MKYMLVWWVLSNPFMVYHGPCVKEADAYAGLMLGRLMHQDWHYEVRPCAKGLDGKGKVKV